MDGFVGGSLLFSISGLRDPSGTILLVDDNPLRASMRKSLLEDSAPDVVRVLDASEALCMVESPQFAQGLALVVTGHRMNGISGPEFVAELRTRMPQVPVLVLSAVADANRDYEEISNVVVSQTASPDELRSLVRRLMSVGQRQTA
jgi:CheY-like chemotaxis protein